MNICPSADRYWNCRLTPLSQTAKLYTYKMDEWKDENAIHAKIKKHTKGIGGKKKRERDIP